MAFTIENLLNDLNSIIPKEQGARSNEKKNWITFMKFSNNEDMENFFKIKYKYKTTITHGKCKSNQVKCTICNSLDKHVRIIFYLI